MKKSNFHIFVSALLLLGIVFGQAAKLWHVLVAHSHQHKVCYETNGKHWHNEEYGTDDCDYCAVFSLPYSLPSEPQLPQFFAPIFAFSSLFHIILPDISYAGFTFQGRGPPYFGSYH